MPHKLLVTRDMGEDAMSLLLGRSELEVILWPRDYKADRSWILDNAPGCEGILVTLNDQVDEELLTKAGPSLKVVSTMSVGYEHVQLAALSERKIKLGYTPDVLTGAVADIAIMLSLMAARNAQHGLSVVKSGQWPTVGWAPFGFCGPQLGPGPVGKHFTVGFLGFGRISQATLHRLVPFGITRAIYTDSGRGSRSSVDDEDLLRKYAGFGQLEEIKRVEMDGLAAESDLLILLAPGGASTRHIISTRFLKQMKRTAVLVNPGRGSLVDSDALFEALQNGWLYAAGLDVVENEPNITVDHPLVRCDRATILPHIGSATIEARAAMASLAVRNLIAGVLGDALPAEVMIN